MKNIWKAIQSLVPLLIIIILSLLPVYFTWGRLRIGGDIMIPFDVAPLKKYLYQWLAVHNGGFFVQNYYPLYLLYSLADWLKLSLYQTSGLIYFLINFAAGAGVYQITKLFSPKDKNFLLRLIPVCLYLFSPALLNGWQYLYFYGVLPWFCYFIFKTVLRNELGFLDLIWLQIILCLGSLDLPNPKYLFYLFVALLTALIVSTYLGEFRAKNLKYLFLKFILLIGLSLYLILPLLYFILHYNPVDYGVHVRSGYNDFGQMMDAGVSTVRNMFTMHHGANLNNSVQEGYLKNPLAILAGYLIIFSLSFGIFYPNNKSPHAKLKLILSALVVVFLFLATGPNPPFGFLYEFLVTKVTLLAFLRTTAGAVLFLSLFYALYSYLLVEENKKYERQYILGSILLIFLLGYPIIFGSYYNNVSKPGKSVNTLEKGYVLPEDYLRVADGLNNLYLDQKTLYPDADPHYIHTDWGYFGPPIYYFLYNNYPLFKDRMVSTPANHNVGLIFVDKSTATRSAYLLQAGDTQVISSGIIQVTAPDRDTYLPHLQIIDSSPSTGETLEFFKINPTKYRLVLHHVKDDFQINFSEQYNLGWQIYPGFNLTPQKYQSPPNWPAQYHLFEGNSLDQATVNELSGYLEAGEISTLGVLRPQQKLHYRWEQGLKKLDHSEPYTIDFISKKYQGTIQNNNLPNNIFWETWTSQPIANLKHQVVNKYANSWSGNVGLVCEVSKNCVRHSDGSFDLELVLEFWPQRLFYLSLGISILSTLLCLLGWLFTRPKVN